MFLPGEFHGQRSLAGYSPQGRKDLDTTDQLNNNNLSKEIEAQKVERAAPNHGTKGVSSPVHRLNPLLSSLAHLHRDSRALTVPVVQLLSHGQLFVTPWPAVCQAFLSSANLEFAKTHAH